MPLMTGRLRAASRQERGARGAGPLPRAWRRLRAGGGPVVCGGDALLDAVRLPALFQRIQPHAHPADSFRSVQVPLPVLGRGIVWG
jgi:hypothetical protein